jgi:predicted nucleotide-binding protein (sugar kinase/HSP70/actin superfamily)
VFLIDQNRMDQGAMNGGGLEINIPLTLGMVWAILCTDALQSLEYRTRPYEVEPGQTDKVVKESVEELAEVFRNRPSKGEKWGPLAWHLTTSYFIKALREIYRKFDAIEVDRLQVKPVVKITGEFYLQTVEGDPNYNIHRWLESEGAEVYPAAIVVWLDYWIRFYVQELEDRVGTDRSAQAKIWALKGLQKVFRGTYNRMRKALGNIPHDIPDQYELRRLAAPYFHHRLSGGEGDMLIGKALWAHLHKKAHMVCELSPYSCMPNTMSIGAMAGVVGQHPDLLYAPIEVKGDAEVHALSRCQMILTEAKKRAIREYVKAMEKTGLDPEAVRQVLDRNPAMRKATYRVPHMGVAGTAANTMLHVAERYARQAA